jgi:hypothetical protein
MVVLGGFVCGVLLIIENHKKARVESIERERTKSFRKTRKIGVSSKMSSSNKIDFSNEITNTNGWSSTLFPILSTVFTRTRSVKRGSKLRRSNLGFSTTNGMSEIHANSIYVQEKHHPFY